MGFLDRLLGRPASNDQRQVRSPDNDRSQYQRSEYQDPAAPWGSPPATHSSSAASTPQSLTDDQAIERYRYLLRTAPPDKIEQAHREAFATLTPEQRGVVLQELSRDLPPGERPAGDDPQQLARAATRAEMRNPGTLERSFSRSGGMGGMGMGGALAGGLLAGVAGAFIGTAVADAMFDSGPFDGGLIDTGGDAEAAAAADTGAGDAGGDYGDGGGFDGGFDGGGDFGGF